MKHLTVVYTIADESSFTNELATIMDRFTALGEKPWCITAVSTDHEIRRLELIEEALEDEDLLLANAVLSHADIGNVASLTEL